jgi:hypothetical protein
MKTRMKKNNIYKDIFMVHNEQDVLCYVIFMLKTREIKRLDRRTSLHDLFALYIMFMKCYECKNFTYNLTISEAF